MSTLLDNACINPGPQGWGEEFQSLGEKVKEERNNFDKLAESLPMMMVRRDVPDINETNMEVFKQLMAQDGIVKGAALRYLEKLAFGRFLEWLAQIVGSCVASGNMRAVARRCLAEIFIFNDPETLFGTKLVGTNNVAIFAPYSYRAGRRLANMNRGDGSYCSVHIRGQRENGMLPCSTPGLVSDAFPEPQSASLYRQWGNTNSLMDQFVSTARKYLLLESEKVTNAADSKVLIGEHLKPHMVCSNWAFKPDYVHPTWKIDGEPVVIYKRDRMNSWAHNMTIDGQVEIETSEEFTFVDNSWGQRAHKNGSFFVIPTELHDDWCRDSEQMSIGEIDMTDNSSPVKE